MSFVEKNGSYEVKLANGEVVRFDSEEEMRAAQEYDESIQELLGHVVERPKAVEVSGEKKKVRITIDPDVEFVVAERDNPSVGRADTSLYTKEAKRKALA